MNLLLIEVVKSTHLVGDFKIFHVEYLASGQHVGALNGALAYLLVDDGLIYFVLDSMWEGRLGLELISLIGILIST